MPLALVVHATRTVPDVPLTVARRVLAGKVTRWSQLQAGRGALRLARADTGSAAAAVRRVRSDPTVLAVVPASAVDATVHTLTVDGSHPLRQPGRYPLHLQSPQPVPEVTTVTVVGDVMLGRRVAEAMRAAGDPARPLRPLAGRLASAEVTVGNFESTLSRDGVPTQGADSFGADPNAVDGLRLAGFDVLSLANNHVGDYGERAMRQTFDRFRRAGIPTVGAGRDLAAARRPVVTERDGVRIGFLATDSIGETPAAGPSRAGTNRLNMPPRTGPLDRQALRRITADIRALRSRVDVVVVVPHWGTQYTHRVERSQRRAARAFAAAGADLVLGGHPHWVQGWETVGSTVVVHSLGNFVFDMDFQTKTREGIFVEVVLWGGRVKAVEPVPYVIGSDFAPRAVGGPRAARILSDVWSTSRGPFRRP
jgi:poly-gamma-glutamate capsule biosynthesis protein CapA/YwtB (metallophosphatase superfamily)